MTNALATYQQKAPVIHRLAEVLPLETPEDVTAASAVLRQVKTIINALESERKAQVKPIKDQAAAIDAQYREPRRALQDLESKLKKRIGEAHARHEQARAAALTAASEAAQAGDTQAAALAVAQAAAPAPSAEGVSVRYTWKPLLVDAHAVPREYLTVDAAKLSAVGKAHGTGPTPPEAIPGIQWHREPVVVARSVK